MVFKNGYITVEVSGFYYIYSQMYYYSLATSFMGHTLKIDGHSVLSGYNNDAGAKKNLNTNYIGGVFRLQKGQTISVGTPFTLNFFYDSQSAYFGAFMVHPV